MNMKDMKHSIEGAVIRYKNHVAVAELDAAKGFWTVQVYEPIKGNSDAEFGSLPLENISEWEKTAERFKTEGEALAAAFDFIESI